ncbi:hypothetical protein Patl1_24370 [Pistacia atlantica]|uniref:Uncharacterized protein n=1 Tax=Pistacia atlantica TaxID=434234 RepID=A0ACC1A0H0_9ROSI|nr:hypothetical protein Patl1_24370 [Pistacia atlantica]
MAAHFPLLHATSVKFRTNAIFGSPSSAKLNGTVKFRTVTCCSSNGREPEPGDGAVKRVERLLEEKRRAELSARIASGEFTVESSGPSKDPGSKRARLVLSEVRHSFIPLYELYLTYGGIFRLTFGPKSFLIVSDPSIAKHILKDNSKSYSKGILAEILDFVMGKGLIPADGEIWRVRRRAIVPALHQKVTWFLYFLTYIRPKRCQKYSRKGRRDFTNKKEAICGTRKKQPLVMTNDFHIDATMELKYHIFENIKYVAAMISLFGEATDRLCKKLDAAASDGEDVEMESLFSRLTLDIIGKAVFNYDFDSLTNDAGIVEAVYTVLREAEDRSVSPIPVWEIPIWKDVSPRLRKVNAALKLINDTLDELIAICKRMVDEEELQFGEEYMNEQDPSILHFLLASGDDVSSKQLRDDLMTMLIAGHETSAAVLTWTFYLLSKEPAVVSKLQDEVDSVLGDRFPTIEDMKKLKYTNRVINESLRLYPQPPVLIRRSLENDTLGKYPIKRSYIHNLMQYYCFFARGEDIFISLWNLHRSPHLWDDADKFNPERWPLDGPNPNETNQNFRYLPFGGGPRKCIGDMFASFETVVAVAMLVRRFNFQIALGAPAVKMTTGATIHTTEGLKMTVTQRIKPPIMPILKEDATVSSSKGETKKQDNKSEISPAHSN